MSRIQLLLICLTACFSLNAQAETIAIVAEKVYTMDGKPLSNAVVLIRDGKIVAVGRDVKIPKKARVLRAKVVLPGLIAAYTHLGGNLVGDRPLDARRLALTGFDQHARYRSAIAEGVTAAYIAATGRLVGGQGAVVRLGGPPAQRVIKQSASVEIALGSAALNPPSPFKASVPPSSANPFRAAKASYPTTRMGTMALLRHMLDQAKLGSANGGGPLKGDLKVWTDVINGKRPLFVRAEKASDILRALWLADRYSIRMVLVGATEGYKVAHEIARRKVPVIIDAMASGDRTQPYADARGSGKEGQVSLSAAAVLSRAGVKVAISSSAPSRVSQLLINAAMAIRAGMKPADALAACTRIPAEILGISASHGRIAEGCAADLLIFNGEPFGAGTVVSDVLIAGQVVYRRPSLPDLGPTPALPIAAKITAIRAGKILTVSRGVITDGVILISRGKILKVGGRDLRIPKGARVINAQHLTVAPGMIDLDSHIGVSRVLIPGITDRYSPITSLARSGIPLNLATRPGDPVFARALANGLTAALLSPPRGAAVSGGGTLIKLAGKTREEMLIQTHAALKFNFAGSSYAGAQIGLKKKIERALLAGKKYTEKWDKYLEKKRKGIKEKPKMVVKKVKKNDPISGTWEAKLSFRGRQIQSFKMIMKLEGTAVSGRMEGRGQNEEFEGGTFEGTTLTLNFKSPMGNVKLTAELTEPNQLEGSIDVGQFKLGFEAERTSATGGSTTTRREKDRPKIIRKLEPFRPLFHKKIPAIVAANTSHEIKAVLETFFDKYGIKKLVLISAPASRHIAGELVRRGVPVLLNPQGASLASGSQYFLPGILSRQGIPIALGSGAYDASILLPLQASVMTRRGISPTQALEAVTILPARILGQAHRIGSIEPGKDADLVFWTGHPMALGSRVERVLVNGKQAFKRGARRRSR